MSFQKGLATLTLFASSAFGGALEDAKAIVESYNNVVGKVIDMGLTNQAPYKDPINTQTAVSAIKEVNRRARAMGAGLESNKATSKYNKCMDDSYKPVAMTFSEKNTCNGIVGVFFETHELTKKINEALANIEADKKGGRRVPILQVGPSKFHADPSL